MTRISTPSWLAVLGITILGAMLLVTLYRDNQLTIYLGPYASSSLMFEEISYPSASELERNEIIGAIRHAVGPNAGEERLRSARIITEPTASVIAVLNAFLAVNSIGVDRVTVVNAKTAESASISAPGGGQLHLYDEVWAKYKEQIFIYRDEPWVSPNSKQAYAWLRLSKQSANAMKSTVLWPLNESLSRKVQAYCWIVLVAPEADADGLIKYVGGLQKLGARDVWVHWEQAEKDAVSTTTSIFDSFTVSASSATHKNN